MQTTAEQMRPVRETFAVLSDPAIRRLGRRDPAAMLAEMDARGIKHGVSGDVEVKTVFSTADTMYMAIPEFTDAPLDDADLRSVQGGNANGTASTAACAGSASTIMCFTTTASSASTAGSVGSMGCATEAP